MNLVETFSRIHELVWNNNDPELIGLIDCLEKEIVKIIGLYKIDRLTGVNNRFVLNENSFDYSVVVMCDIDNFKEFNDKGGHQFGDELLKIFADKLKSLITSEDILIRYGGDEFTIIFKNIIIDDVIKKLEDVRNKIHDIDLEAILSAIESENSYNEIHDLSFSASFGVSEYSIGKRLGDAIMEADMALYESKNSGRDRVTYRKKINN